MLTYSNFIHFRHDGKIHVGQLYVFAVVGYREHGETQEQGRTLFAQVRPYDDDGIVKRDVCGAYKYKTEATVRIRKKIWIHATRMCTYMFKPHGSDKSVEERRLHVNFVPVAKAFVQD